MSGIPKAWAEVSEEDRLVGGGSYPTYHLTLRGFAGFYGFGIVPTVEAFAALSPNNDYHGNLRSLASVMFACATGRGLESVTVSTYRACAERAWGYLTGEVSFLDTVRGPKITAFRHNLLYPDSSQRVTVDGHMIALWAGRDMTMKEAARELTPTIYRAIEKDVARIARAEGLSSPAVQATLWVYRKRTRGILFSAQRELFSGAGRWDEPCLPEDYPPFNAPDWRGWSARKCKARA